MFSSSPSEEAVIPIYLPLPVSERIEKGRLLSGYLLQYSSKTMQPCYFLEAAGWGQKLLALPREITTLVR